MGHTTATNVSTPDGPLTPEQIRSSLSKPTCDFDGCGAPATCWGYMEAYETASYNCDEHCAHRPEDGTCIRVAGKPVEPHATE